MGTSDKGRRPRRASVHVGAARGDLLDGVARKTDGVWDLRYAPDVRVRLRTKTMGES